MSQVGYNSRYTLILLCHVNICLLGLPLHLLFSQTSVNIVLSSSMSLLDEFKDILERVGLFGKRVCQNPANIPTGQQGDVLLMGHSLL